jgi:protein-S-isoprenylcysteine O-methyltransferase Ste14
MNGFIGRVVLFLIVLFWGSLHSLLASHAVKQRLRRGAFLGTDQAYRLAYNAVAILTFLPVLAALLLTPDVHLFTAGMPLFVFLVLAQLLAVLLLVIGFLQTGPLSFLGLAPADEQGGLVTSGLYRFMRHPLYTAGLILIWCMPYMTANSLTINIALTLYVAIGAMFEEARLRKVFGQQYLDYARRTPMFLPRLRPRR